MDANTVILAFIGVIQTFTLFILKDMSSRQKAADQNFIDHLKDHS